MDPSEDPTTARNTAFRKANEHQDELVKSGVSLSGHERNCCFLNTGAERFANISAAAGLDHIGDGRAYVRVDWDHDGDLDLWSTNRTAPRVQFLRNDADSGNHFLTVKLRGTGPKTNHDAIGARVEVVLANPKSQIPNPKSIKTLRAGEGFLAQSSNWIHFGLGADDQIDRLIVHWPGGQAEEFTDLKADRHYAIVQGSGRADVWTRPVAAAELEASENEGPPRTDLARIPLRFPIPLPTFQYETFDGEQVSMNKYLGSPTLVNLWASWCQPCLGELVEFRDHADELRSAGLTIVALSVDAVAEDAAADLTKAQAFWERQDFPFQGGMADATLIHQIEVVLKFLFDHRRRWTVPTSFLLNSEGHLAAIYFGRVDIDELMSDASILRSDERAWFQSSMPFAGRWANEQRLPNMWPFVETLLEEDYRAEAVDYFTRLEKLQAPTDTFPDLLVKVGAALREEGNLTAAADRLRQAVELQPENVYAHLQLANLLSQLGQIEDAMEHCREVLKLQPDNFDALVGLGNILLTKEELGEAINYLQRSVQLKPDSLLARVSLGNSYFAEKQWEQAIEQFKKAANIDPDAGEAHYQLARALQKSSRLEDSVSSYKQALRITPDSSKIRYSFGTALLELGKVDDSIQQFREAHKLDPESLTVLNGLAWLLATTDRDDDNDATLALNLAQQAAQKTNFSHPQILDTLAAAYAASGDFHEAVSTAERAIALADKGKTRELTEEIRARLNEYRRGEPHRESGSTHSQ